MPPASRRFLRRVPTPLAAAALLALAPLLADAPLAAQRTDRAPVPPRTAAPPRAATPAAATDSARWGRTGLVTDSTGAPIVAATVLEVRTGVVQSTDSAGRFRVRGARIGTVSLEIRAAGYEPMVFDYEQLPGDTATLTVPLVALDEPPPLPFARLAGSLAGRVLDPSGRPLVGATIQVLTALKEVRTDTLGRFALAGL
nr:carboxypeptidase-like regulatory domain-containing protein [Gemmatimonadaceae bacterium]